MTLPSRLHLASERRRRLVDVARGLAAPDLVIHASTMLDVYTGELRPAEIGVAEGRIAWVVGIDDARATPSLHLSEGVLVPGFIEPHCHPDILYTPSALAAELVAHGTTTVAADTVFLALALEDHDLLAVLEGMRGASVKFLWNLRGCVDGVLPREIERLGLDRLVRLVGALPDVVATGEMTAWPDLLRHDERLGGLVADAIGRGLRIDGHAAGGSPRTLNPLGAAGITADHEAITAGELVDRARLGYWVMLRHSSLRPDGEVLASAIASRAVPHWRAMITTDGPVAADLVSGHLDAVLRRLVANGVDPIDAVRMATLHPATYLGLDAHIGGIAPGRAADLVLLDSLRDFNVHTVFCDGVATTRESAAIGWSKWGSLKAETHVAADLAPEVLVETCAAGPALLLEGVITREVERTPTLGDDASYLAVVGRDGSWIVGAVLHGLSVRALASTFSGSGDVVLVGNDPAAVVRAYQRVIEAGGGVGSDRLTVPLPCLGSMFDGPVPALAAAMAELADDVGWPPSLPPIEYFMLFNTLAVLPDVRLTPLGAMRVKTREILDRPRPLRLLAGDGRA